MRTDLILHQYPTPEKIASLLHRLHQISSPKKSEELFQKTREEKITEFTDWLQQEYDCWISSLRLEQIEDPSSPGSFPGYRFSGFYVRTFTFSLPDDSQEITVSLRILRIAPKEGGTPTHALLPWYLCSFSRTPLWESLFLLISLFAAPEKGQSVHAAAFERGILPNRLYRLRARHEEFAFHFKFLDLTNQTLWDWITGLCSLQSGSGGPGCRLVVL